MESTEFLLFVSSMAHRADIMYSKLLVAGAIIAMLLLIKYLSKPVKIYEHE